MTSTPKRFEINCETGKESLIPLTDDEIQQLAKDQAIIAETRKNDELREAAVKSAEEKLAALGLTVDEIAALRG